MFIITYLEHSIGNNDLKLNINDVINKTQI